MNRVIAGLFMLLLATGCSSSHRPPDPVANSGDPWYDRAVEVAERAMDEWKDHGTPPDSIESVLKQRPLKKTRGWGYAPKAVITAFGVTAVGRQEQCLYLPIWQYPSMTVRGERFRRIVGFEVTTWSNTSGNSWLRAKIIGIYGPDGKPILIAQPV